MTQQIIDLYCTLEYCGKNNSYGKHLHNFMIEQNLIYKYKSGFLPNNSTVYQLLEMYHNICMSMEETKSTCTVFCDISIRILTVSVTKDFFLNSKHMVYILKDHLYNF